MGLKGRVNASSPNSTSTQTVVGTVTVQIGPWDDPSTVVHAAATLSSLFLLGSITTHANASGSLEIVGLGDTVHANTDITAMTASMTGDTVHGNVDIKALEIVGLSDTVHANANITAAEMVVSGDTVHAGSSLPAVAISGITETVHCTTDMTAATMVVSGDTVHASLPSASIGISGYTDTVHGNASLGPMSIVTTGDTVHGSVTKLQFITGQMLSNADSYADTVALCTTDTTHNATDLQLDSNATTSRDVYISFDLSNFPSSGTVTGATFTINRKVVPALLGWSFNIFAIADANEFDGASPWSESTLKCSNRPAPNGAVLSASGLLANAITGDLDMDMVANVSTNFINRVQQRMGKTSCTFILQMSSAASAATFQSKDSGGTPGNASGPRLSITFKTV